MIETIKLPALTVVGILVEAHWNELPKAVPAAWTRLFDSGLSPEAGGVRDGFVAVSISRDKGFYRELIGVVAGPDTVVPQRMMRLEIPANSYLSLIHDGPLAGIAQGFGSLYEHASNAGHATTDFKLDFGYQPGLPAGRHQLHIGLAPFTAPRTT